MKTYIMLILITLTLVHNRKTTRTQGGENDRFDDSKVHDDKSALKLMSEHLRNLVMQELEQCFFVVRKLKDKMKNNQSFISNFWDIFNTKEKMPSDLYDAFLKLTFEKLTFDEIINYILPEERDNVYDKVKESCFHIIEYDSDDDYDDDPFEEQT